MEWSRNCRDIDRNARRRCGSVPPRSDPTTIGLRPNYQCRRASCGPVGHGRRRSPRYRWLPQRLHGRSDRRGRGGLACAIPLQYRAGECSSSGSLKQPGAVINPDENLSAPAFSPSSSISACRATRSRCPRAVLQSGRASRRATTAHCRRDKSQLFDLLRKRRRHRKAAIANNLSRHTVPNLPVRLRVKWQGEVGMRVNVDETGRHDLTLRIDKALGAVSSVLFDGRNPLIPDCHIRRARRRARPVDD